MSTILLKLLINLELLNVSLIDEINDISKIIKNASIKWSKINEVYDSVLDEHCGLMHPFILSEKLFKKDIFIYATPKTKSIGYRFKSQLSENTKILSIFTANFSGIIYALVSLAGKVEFIEKSNFLVIAVTNPAG